ncbi:uncharacterized protein [Heterodontus francisci]|uniref:uncharacterized protein n=1 Tax=Heterodontus francisci TaxID=7792 RepID=UPI00355C82EF
MKLHSVEWVLQGPSVRLIQLPTTLVLISSIRSILLLLYGASDCLNTHLSISERPLGEKKGQSIDVLLEDGRKYKTIVEGQQHLQALGAANSISMIIKSQKASKPCGKCGLSNSRCMCKACSAKGHWVCLCKKSGSKDAARTHSRTQTNRRQAQRQGSRSKEFTRVLHKPIHEVYSETDLRQESEWSDSQPEDEQAFHIVNLTHCVESNNWKLSLLLTSCAQRKLANAHSGLRLTPGLVQISYRSES